MALAAAVASAVESCAKSLRHRAPSSTSTTQRPSSESCSAATLSSPMTPVGITLRHGIHRGAPLLTGS